MDDLRVAFLFPGQGAYVQGVLPQLGRMWAGARKIFERVDATCVEAGVAPVSDILDDPAATLDVLVRTAPERLSLIIYATSLCGFSLLSDLGRTPFWLMGHSLGEIAALVCGGAFSLEDGARILHARNRALTELALTDGGMLAINIGAERANALTRLLDDPRICVACYNGPRQCVLSGTKATLDRAQALAVGLGLRTTEIASPYPFHNPMLAPAVRGFAQAIHSLPQRPFERSVYSPIQGKAYSDTDDLGDLIARHLVRPVHWVEMVRQAHEAGIDEFVECGAGAALTGLAARSLAGIRTFAPLANAVTLESALTEGLVGASAIRLDPVVPPGRAQAPVPAAGEPVIGVRTAQAPVAPVLDAPPIVDRQAIANTVRGICADLLSYPPEVFQDEADLEAELGIDSIKRVELVSAVLGHLGLPATNRRAAAANTFGELVIAVADLKQSGLQVAVA